jgi:hypothetical protein
MSKIQQEFKKMKISFLDALLLILLLINILMRVFPSFDLKVNINGDNLSSGVEIPSDVINSAVSVSSIK